MRTLFVTLLAVAFASPVVAQTAAPLSVDEAVALAIAHNRRIASADLEVDKSIADTESARTRRLPQFSLEMTMSELLRPIDVMFPQGSFGTYPGVGPIPSVDTALVTKAKPTMLMNAQVSQPLTQLREINLNVRLSESASQLARETARATRLTVGYEVKRLYFSILQNDSAIQATTHSVAMLKELGRVVGNRVIQNAALKSDALDVDTRLARLEQQRLGLEHAMIAQKERLNQLMGRDVRTPFETIAATAADLASVDLDAAQSRAIDSRPEIREARIKLDQAKTAHRIAKADRLPDLSIALSYTSPINIDGAPRNIASVGLQFQWEPFDWGRRSRTIASRRLTVQQAENAVRDQEDGVVMDVSAQYRKLAEARLALRVAALAQEQAREVSRHRADQYRVQAVLLSDVLQAAASQADADKQWQQAIADWWLARAEFERALGEE